MGNFSHITTTTTNQVYFDNLWKIVIHLSSLHVVEKNYHHNKYKNTTIFFQHYFPPQTGSMKCYSGMYVGVDNLWKIWQQKWCQLLLPSKIIRICKNIYIFCRILCSYASGFLHSAFFLGGIPHVWEMARCMKIFFVKGFTP